MFLCTKVLLFCVVFVLVTFTNFRSEVSLLKVGDTLLEINGSPITSENATQVKVCMNNYLHICI